MTAPINLEAQALALGIIKALRTRGPLVDALTERAPDFAREYSNLVDRALAVDGSTNLAEVADIYDLYLKLAAKFLPKGMEN